MQVKECTLHVAAELLEAKKKMLHVRFLDQFQFSTWESGIRWAIITIKKCTVNRFLWVRDRWKLPQSRAFIPPFGPFFTASALAVRGSSEMNKYKKHSKGPESPGKMKFIIWDYVFVPELRSCSFRVYYYWSCGLAASECTIIEWIFALDESLRVRSPNRWRRPKGEQHFVHRSAASNQLLDVHMEACAQSSVKIAWTSLIKESPKPK